MKPQESAEKSITRRNFMKNTVLTAGGITLLSRGIGFAALNGGVSGCTHDWNKNGGVEQNGGKCKAFKECKKCGRQETWEQSHWPAGSNNGWVNCLCGGNSKLQTGCAWTPRTD